MNHKVIGIKITPEGADKRTAEPPKRDGKAYVLNTSRIMYLYIESLQVSKDAHVPYFGDSEIVSPPAMSLYVRGKATLGGGSISVIGATGTQSREFSIGFNAFDEDIRAQRQALALRQGTTARFTRVTIGYVHRQLHAVNDHWFVECELATDMRQAIASAVSSGTLRAITLGLALRGIYSDDWTRPSALTDWFLRPNPKDKGTEAPQMAHADITRLSFDMASVDLRRPTEEDSEQNAFQDTIPAMMAA